MKNLSIIPTKNISRILHKAIKSPGFAIHSFYRRLLSYLTYRFGNGYSAPPETISFFLSYRCNLKCSMCGQWGEHGIYKDYAQDKLKQGLALGAIKKLMQEFSSFKPTITLFGGEPTLYKDWVSVVQIAKENGLRCNIVTNAVLLARYAGEMVKLGLDEIIFSLDGPRDIHDKIRGVKGTFDRAMEGFKLLKQFKKEQRKKKPLVTINATVNGDNYNRLSELIEIADEIGAYHLNIHHLLFLNKDICDRHNTFFKGTFGVSSPDWYGFVWAQLPQINPDILLQEFKKIRDIQSSAAVNFYPNFTDDEIKKYYTGWEFESESYSNRCLSPWMVAYIFPDGSVVPYHTMNYPMGNVNESSFNEIWNNARYRRFRQVLRKIKRFHVCSKGCTELYRY
ncbi:MAG: radical SAM protein [Deltaproteobacteria bacterium]|nr:radical SAM protein [Deltaproteobacteria bacterium]